MSIGELQNKFILRGPVADCSDSLLYNIAVLFEGPIPTAVLLFVVEFSVVGQNVDRQNVDRHNVEQT